jgi:hypothetical protein
MELSSFNVLRDVPPSRHVVARQSDDALLVVGAPC